MPAETADAPEEAEGHEAQGQAPREGPHGRLLLQRRPGPVATVTGTGSTCTWTPRGPGGGCSGWWCRAVPGPGPRQLSPGLAGRGPCQSACQSEAGPRGRRPDDPRPAALPGRADLRGGGDQGRRRLQRGVTAGRQDGGPVAFEPPRLRLPALRRHERRSGDDGRHHGRAASHLDGEARHRPEGAPPRQHGHAPARSCAEATSASPGIAPKRRSPAHRPSPLGQRRPSPTAGKDHRADHIRSVRNRSSVIFWPCTEPGWRQKGDF